MRKRIFNIIFCIILLSMTFQSVPAKANDESPEIRFDKAPFTQQEQYPNKLNKTLLPTSSFHEQFDDFNDTYYSEMIRLEKGSANKEYLAELGLEYSIDPYNYPKERKYIPPTPEVIAKTQEQVRSFDCSTVTDVPQIECEALVALYASTNGAGWDNNTNWLIETTIDSWYGIYVEDFHIVLIDLDLNQLNGSIPPELGNLSKLESLELNNNPLSGTIPPELGNLSNLTGLSLFQCQLSGSIPPELGNLNNLIVLYLYHNQLSGSIPPELGNLGNLYSLNIYFNQLNGSIPQELGNLGNLNYLILSDNQLSGNIPPELGNLSNLNTLNLSSNQLSGSIPSELGNLGNLNSLSLSENLLSGSIPLSFINLSLLGFKFYYTDICEPSSPEFLAWKATVHVWQGTGIICAEPLNQVDLDASNSIVVLSIEENEFQLKENQPAITELETTIINHGPDPTTQLTVEFHDGFPSIDTKIAENTIFTINSGESTTVRAKWDVEEKYTGPIEANIYVKVSSSDNDTNLSNNVSLTGTSALIAFTQFSYNPDTFNFSNVGLDRKTFFQSLFEFSSIVDYYNHRFVYEKVIVPTIYFLFQDAGHCYGMSSSSIIYWDTPLAKPVPPDTDTYQIEWEMDGVASDIEAAHFRQLLKIIGIGLRAMTNISLARPSTAYNNIKEQLMKDFAEPSVLSLFNSMSKSSYQHSVTAYKIVELDGQKYIYVYDNNFPMNGDFPNNPNIISLDERQNLFIYQYIFEGKTITREIPRAIALEPVRTNSWINKETLMFIIDSIFGIFVDSKSLQGFYEWNIDESQITIYSNSILGIDNVPAFDIPPHFLILDVSGNKLGFDQGVFVNEIAGSEFIEFDSAFYWLLPENGIYTLETEGLEITNATLSLAIPLDTSLIQTTIYDGFGIPQDAIATTSFSQTTTDWRIEIEGQDDILPVVDEEIPVEGIKSVFLPLIMKE